jgi:hypothetical protein
MRYAIRGFRGTRRSSIYREHLVTATVLMRLVEAAEQKGLPVLASLREDRELTRGEARQLAGELDAIRARQELPDLDRDLVAIAEVARWCAHARGEARLRIALLN